MPSPSSLAFASLTGGQVQFYAATEGREAAALVALSLVGGEISGLTALPPSSGVAQLVPLEESSLALVGTLLTVTIESSAGELTNASETEAIAALAVSFAEPTSLGQPVLGQTGPFGPNGDETELLVATLESTGARQSTTTSPAWQRYTLGTDEALERFDREHPEVAPDNDNTPSATGRGDGMPGPGLGSPDDDVSEQSWISAQVNGFRAQAADIVIGRLCGNDRRTFTRQWWSDDAVAYASLAIAATDPIATARATCSSLLHSLAVIFQSTDLAEQEAAIRRPVSRIPDGGWALAGQSSPDSWTASASLVLASAAIGYIYVGQSARPVRSKNQRLSASRWHRR